MNARSKLPSAFDPGRVVKPIVERPGEVIEPDTFEPINVPIPIVAPVRRSRRRPPPTPPTMDAADRWLARHGARIAADRADARRRRETKKERRKVARLAGPAPVQPGDYTGRPPWEVWPDDSRASSSSETTIAAPPWEG